MTHRSPWAVLGRYASLVALMSFLLVPALWLAYSALRPNREIFGTPKISLSNLTLENFRWALSERGLGMAQLLQNTFAVCLMTAALTTVFACLAGYGLVRYRGTGARIAIVGLLVAQMVQGPMIMIPWYKIAATLDLLNTREVLVLIYQTLTLPAAVWLMASFFRAIPSELEEAASIDGASRLRTMRSIILPLALPGITAVGLYSFILAWNDYQYALILTSSKYSKTVQIGIAQVMDSMGSTNWGGIMAGGVLAIIPAVVVFAIVQKALVEGLSAGAVKG
ncbi:carbohydrate ABC transporter permease [Sanguibacter sp. A247]|uniref:carbohydrate ABC transporter permease n=1 Tax=unclassified Sanguibacter TaxID=2645534 RepID=UPI003FD8EE66